MPKGWLEWTGPSGIDGKRSNVSSDDPKRVSGRMGVKTEGARLGSAGVPWLGFSKEMVDKADVHDLSSGNKHVP